jgi:outer membrane lipoprotein-sorting protein
MVRSIHVSVLFCLALTVGGVARAQTVDEIVAKNLQAKGGAEKLRAVNTVKLTGTIKGPGGNATMTMTSWAKRPNMMRRDTVAQNQKISAAFDGRIAWLIDPRQGGEPQELQGPQADLIKQDTDIDPPLLDYKAKGTLVDLVGTEAIDGKKVHHLKITMKRGQVQHYYLDADTGLETRVVMTLEQGGMKAEITNDLSNFQTVDGIQVPFSIRQSANGQPMADVTLEKVEFNTPIDEALFKMPAKQ